MSSDQPEADGPSNRPEHEFISTLLETTNSLIVCLDKNAILTMFNAECERVTGYSREEVLGRSWPDIFLPENDPAHKLDDFADWVRQHPRDTYEGRLLTKTGELRTILWSTSAVFSRDSDDLTAIAVGFDITAYKRAETALKKGEARYRAIVEDQTELVCRSRVDTTLTFVNESYARLYRLTPKEMIGRRFLSFIPQEEHDDVTAYFAAMGADNPVDEHIHRVITGDGQIRWYHWTNRAVLDDSGGVLEFQSVGRDITDLMAAEEKLRQSEKRYRELAELLPGGVYERNVGGQITFANRAALEMFGYSRDDFDRGISTTDLLIPEDRERAENNVRRIVQGEESGPNEYTGLTKDGNTFPILVHGSPIYTDGKITGLRGIVTDISARKQAEEALEEARDKLDQRVRERTAELVEANRQLKDQMASRKQAEEALLESKRRYELATIAGRVGVWDWNIQTDTLYVDPKLKMILGLDDDEIEDDQETFIRLLHPDDVDRTIAAAKACIAGETPQFECEYRMMHRNGDILWFLARGTIISDDECKPLLLLGPKIDITERKRANEALKETMEELRHERKKLTEKNIALKQILDHIESDRRQYQQQLCRRVEGAVKPLLAKLMTVSNPKLKTEIKAFHDQMESLLDDEIDNFGDRYATLTPRELDICNLIKLGLSSKQISDRLNLSLVTIHKHREKIRKKLALTNKRINLSSYLRSH